VTGWFLTNMAWASLAMLVVLLIRQPVARLFGAGPAYALWLLPALRLVAPPLPGFAPDFSPTLPPLTLIVSVAEDAAPLPPDGGPGQWVPLLLAIWAGGAAIFLAWQFVAYRRFVRRLDSSARCLGAHRGLGLVESGAVDGPVAIGLLRRRIVVPVDFERRYSPVERRLALDHEAIHHRRFDLWWNHVGLVILALNWFNPLAWAAWRAFRADQELACDAAVTATAAPDERQDYARALIKSASRPGLIAACPLNHADQLKRRLKMMKTHKTGRLRLLAGAGAVTFLVAAGLAVGSPGLAAQQEETKENSKAERTGHHEERIIIRTHRADGEHRDHAAHREHAAGDGRHEERRVIVRTHDGHGGHAEGNADRHRMMMMHLGDRDHMAAAHCGDGQRTEVNEGGDNQRTRVILCNRGDGTPAQRAEHLQRVRERLAGEDDLSAEQRQRVLAAIDREIARLRAQ
jgi:beta-lactamase regulating signal transducer with metallopeptidase domain